MVAHFFDNYLHINVDKLDDLLHRPEAPVYQDHLLNQEIFDNYLLYVLVIQDTKHAIVKAFMANKKKPPIQLPGFREV